VKVQRKTAHWEGFDRMRRFPRTTTPGSRRHRSRCRRAGCNGTAPSNSRAITRGTP